MPITISTVEEFQVTRFGPRIVELTTLLNLPLPTITVHPLTKFERKDLWGFKVNQPGRQTEPTTEAIVFKLMHDDRERGMEVVMQDLVGRLLGRHSRQVRGTHFHVFGRRDDDGESIDFEDDSRDAAEPIRLYLQDLESLIRHVDTDRTNVMLSNDELQVQLREKDKLFAQQDEIVKEMEAKFESQDRKFKSQEKRVQDRYKNIREMKEELETKDFEIEHQQGVIEILHSQKRALKAKTEALTTNVEEYKTTMENAGLTLVDEEVDAEE